MRYSARDQGGAVPLSGVDGDGLGAIDLARMTPTTPATATPAAPMPSRIKSRRFSSHVFFCSFLRDLGGGGGSGGGATGTNSTSTDSAFAVLALGDEDTGRATGVARGGGEASGISSSTVGCVLSQSR